MRIIALVGPFGAGKSTVAMNLAHFLARQGHVPQQVAIVVNEAGGATEIATVHAGVFTLPNGCFTCQDEAALQQALGRLADDGVETVIMEGFGIVSGDETRAFLGTVPYPHVIVGILDVANWAQNQINYSELLPTHLRVAHAIAATKHVGELPAGIRQFLADHHVHAPVTTAPVDSFPADIWSAVAAAFRDDAQPASAERDHPHHDHDHDHDGHGHTHDWQPQVLDVVAGTSLATLRGTVQDLVSAGKMRLKGRLQGQAFNVAPGADDWHVRPASEPGDLVICYLAPHTAWPAALLGLVASPPSTARSHQLLRVDTPHEATVAAIRAGVATMRSWAPSVRALQDGRQHLTTHPEPLQTVKEMARRPGVKATWFVPVITACLDYWVKCAQWLARNAPHVDATHRGTNLRELGVSLAWWALEFEDQLPGDLVQRVVEVRPAAMVEAGLADVTALREDGFGGTGRVWSSCGRFDSAGRTPTRPIRQRRGMPRGGSSPWPTPRTSARPSTPSSSITRVQVDSNGLVPGLPVVR